MLKLKIIIVFFFFILNLMPATSTTAASKGKQETALRNVTESKRRNVSSLCERLCGQRNLENFYSTCCRREI